MKKHKQIKAFIPLIGMILALGTVGCTFSNSGGATGSEEGAATGSEEGGTTGSEEGGATGSEEGGATGSEEGGTTGSEEGGSSETDYTGVKKITESSYSGTELSTLSQTIVTEYDTNGRIIKKIYYNGDGTENYKTENKYDSNGNIVEYKNSYGSQLFSVVTKTYNEKNQLILETVDYEEDQPDRPKRFEHKYEGNKETITSYDATEGGNATQYEERTYDASGNEVEYYWVRNDNFVEAKRKKEYDSKGRIIKIMDYQKDGVVQEEPQIETITTYDDTKLSQTVVCKYRDNESFNSKMVTYYDSKKNIIKFLSYNYKDEVSVAYCCEYTYNQKGYKTLRINKDSFDGGNTYTPNSKSVFEYEYY